MSSPPSPHINNLPRNAILYMKRKSGEFLWIEVTEQSIRPM
jgi:hypothetical protein